MGMMTSPGRPLCEQAVPGSLAGLVCLCQSLKYAYCNCKPDVVLQAKQSIDIAAHNTVGASRDVVTLFIKHMLASWHAWRHESAAM